MKKEDMLIWWLTSEEIKLIVTMPKSNAWGSDTVVPTYLEKELLSAQGRAGRGRLWVDQQFGDVKILNKPLTPFTPLDHFCSQCAGIVIWKHDAPLLKDLPGIITDFNLQRFDSKCYEDNINIKYSDCAIV